MTPRSSTSAHPHWSAALSTPNTNIAAALASASTRHVHSPPPPTAVPDAVTVGGATPGCHDVTNTPLQPGLQKSREAVPRAAFGVVLISMVNTP